MAKTRIAITAASSSLKDGDLSFEKTGFWAAVVCSAKRRFPELKCLDSPFRMIMTKDKITLQFIWGIALFLAGIGVFFRIPQVMPQIKAIPQFADVIGFIYFCFYLLGILLIGGGIRKLTHTYKKYTEMRSP